MNSYEILKKLILTENTYAMVQAHNTVVFKVANNVNKIQIRDAVEKAFGVRTLKANTLIVPGRKRTVRGQAGAKGWRPRFKKAFIKIHPDDISKIPLV